MVKLLQYNIAVLWKSGIFNNNLITIDAKVGAGPPIQWQDDLKRWNQQHLHKIAFFGIIL